MGLGLEQRNLVVAALNGDPIAGWIEGHTFSKADVLDAQCLAARGCVPELDPLVEPHRDEPASVGAEVQTGYASSMGGDRACQPAACDVPQSRRSVDTAGGDQPAVVTEP